MTNRTLANLDYRELAREALDGGFTVALDGSRPTTGYVVALPGHERRLVHPLGGLAEMIYTYVVDHGAALRGNFAESPRNRYMGAWRDGDTVVLDVVEVLPRGHAILMGRLRGQDAIYHLNTGETITLRQGVVKPERRSAQADAEAAADAYADALKAQFDDDPNPYHGDYSED